MGLSQLSSVQPSSRTSSFCIRSFVHFWWFAGLLVTSVVCGNNETDRLALLEFKAKITHDPFGVFSSWNDSIHFCQWRGVTCGRRHQRVTALDLQSLKLVGSISPHIGNLSFLRNISLQNNSFYNEIPPEIGRLFRLQGLSLFNNTMSGKIPSNISGCSNLVVLSVGSNQLVGEIPMTLASMTKLQIIAFHLNNLTGNIPPFFGNFSFLVWLSAAENNLEGIIPHSFGQLTKLTRFLVAKNRLFGTIPPSIFNLSSLRQFDVGYNQIHGRLPSDIGIMLPNIELLSIATSQFIGSIPVSISNASNLVKLDLGDNQLSGKVPSLEKLNRILLIFIQFNNLGNGGENDLSFLCSLSNATYLTELYINFNNFGGELPKCIGNLSTTLATLVLNNNKIFGKILIEIGNLINLLTLDMSQNKLSGNIPLEIGMLQNLQSMLLSTNNFFGNIPPSFGNLTNLIILHLDQNNLQGNIPLSLSNCRNLFSLNLANNNLSGSISPQVIGLSFSPIFLNLSSNQFTGVFPMEVGNFKNLEELDISENMLFGKIPTSLGSCIALEYLYMGSNFFQGIIPLSFKSLRGLQRLDLSNNNLNGQIPKFLEIFVYLEYLNLSYNHFEGEVPTNGVFKNTSATFLEGNGQLCGGIPEFQLPKCKYEESNKRRLSLTLKLIISISLAFFGVILVLSLLLIYSLRKKRKVNTIRGSQNLLLSLSYQSLLNATDGFSSANLIGVGSFGSVYKGSLDQGGKVDMVAVKVLNLLRHGASKSFIAECEAQRNIRHRNLVKLLTSCSSIDYQGHDFKALVYEFMENGNLDEWLHPRDEALDKTKNLSFLQRLNIAIDVANALDYLHHHCQTPIIHCDLKPSNILLDDEMMGHVGDFGLSRLLFDATQDFSVDQSSSIEVRGTIGYTPPEYGMGNEVSAYGDIYSYGILLLEMFTGKRPIDNIFQDGLNLHDFVKSALPRQVIDIMDPLLLSWKSEEGEATIIDITCNEGQNGSPIIQDCLIVILEIGVACSVELPSERKNIGAVIIELCSIQQKLFELLYIDKGFMAQVDKDDDYYEGGHHDFPSL